MDFNTASWFALLGFLGYALPQLFEPKHLRTDEVVDSKKRAYSMRRWEAVKWAAYIGIAIQIVTIWQGFHLLQAGYSVDFDTVDPAVIWRASARAGGRGGLILLIIRFLPYFFIGGYVWLAWNTLLSHRRGSSDQKRLRVVDRYLTGISQIHRKAFHAGLKYMLEKHPRTYPLEGAFSLAARLAEQDKQEPISYEEHARPPATTNDNDELQYLVKAAPQSSKAADTRNIDPIEHELCKIKALRDKGLISDNEYQALRQKVLGL